MPTMAETMEKEEVGGLIVRPLTPHIGAEIEGVDATQPIPEAQAEQLNALLNKWKVIFFRDQPMTPEQQVEFAGTFGPVDYSYYINSPGLPSCIQTVKNRGDQNVDKWHTDTSWRVHPAKCAVLRGVTVPDIGGDTIWANGVRAYQTLPNDVKERIENLDAIHDASRISSYVRDPDELALRMAMNRETRKKNPLVAQPLVRTHPETGEQALYVNHNLMTQIVGLSVSESRELIDYLVAHYSRPENTCRFHWTMDAIAVWDQRQTMHYAVNDYAPDTPRELHRILVGGQGVAYR